MGGLFRVLVTLVMAPLIGRCLWGTPSFSAWLDQQPWEALQQHTSGDLPSQATVNCLFEVHMRVNWIINFPNVTSSSHRTLSNFEFSVNAILCSSCSGSCRTHEWIKIMLLLFYGVLYRGILTSTGITCFEQKTAWWSATPTWFARDRIKKLHQNTMQFHNPH